MKISIIANPTAGRGRAYKKLKEYVGRWPHQDWEVELLPTQCPEHAGEIARELASRPPDIVAVCGGDGTVSEVATFLPDPPFPVAVIPSGTSNVLAKELGLSADPIEALRKALDGRTRRVDMGILKGRSERRFLLMAGIGFDAYIVSKVRPGMKARMGEAAYLIEVLRSVAGYSYSRFQVITEAGSFNATSCIVANARGYGGKLVFSPEADLGDGFFDLLILEESSWLGYVRFLRSAQRGKPREFPWVRRCRCRTVKIEGPRGIWVQADGELFGTLPVDITIVPSCYPLVVPK